MDLLADMEHVGGLLASAARLEIMPRFHRLTATSVREKSSSFDVVTEADEAAETVIAEGLRAAFPHAAIIGEEAAERDPSLLQGLGSAELAFLIDPLDGTKNFTARLPLFGLMAAAIWRGDLGMAPARICAWPPRFLRPPCTPSRARISFPNRCAQPSPTTCPGSG